MTRLFFGTIILLAALFSSAAAQNNTIQHWFEKGTTEARKGEFAVALKDLEVTQRLADAETASDRFRAKVHFNIGVCLYRLRRSVQAVIELKQAVRLYDGPYEKAYYALGMAEVDLKHMPAARDAFQSALKADPKNGEAWFDLAFVYLNNNDMEAAGEAFRKAIENGTVSSAVSHNNLGVTLLLKDDFAAAEKEFETALVESGGMLEQAKLNLAYTRARSKADARFVAKADVRCDDPAN